VTRLRQHEGRGHHAVSVFLATHAVKQKAVGLLNGVFEGVWLGILSSESLYEISRRYYAARSRWHSQHHNLIGLWDWESAALKTHFDGCQRVLVSSTGGGREVLGLLTLGYDAYGFECNEQLVEVAEKLLTERGRSRTVQLVPPDAWPEGERYDGVVLGWNSYSHITTRERRVEFLRSARASAPEGAPMLLSFRAREERAKSYKLVSWLENFILRVRGREIQPVGDRLALHFFEHNFTEDQLAGELSEGGFRLIEYSTEGEPHAVARAVGPPPVDGSGLFLGAG